MTIPTNISGSSRTVEMDITDVSGHWADRKNWESAYSEDVSAIVFLVDLAGYDLGIRESNAKVRYSNRWIFFHLKSLY